MEWRPDRESAASTASSTRVRGLRAYPELSSRLGAVVVALGLLLAVLEGRDANHNLIAVGLAAAALGRGIGLRRPVLVPHIVAAVALLVLAHFADADGQRGFTQLAIVVAGVVALWAPPAPSPGTAAERRRIWGLVNATSNDCLAPFAMRRDKSYVFSPDGLAAVAYRVRFGVAVASGDPLGEVESQPQAVAAFIAMAGANGWRIGVLGTGEEWTQWWRERGMRALPIGRDVVINVETFAMTGRAFRNLRQAVQRTRNAGVTTEIYPAESLPPDVAQAVKEIVKNSRRNPNRGFSMILDGLLDDPPHPGTLLAVAYDANKEIVAFHRFSSADRGREITQDLPWRRRGAPNGVDERLAYDVVEWAKANDARRVSLSFAAFPELYASTPNGVIEQVSYWLTHRLDRFIRLESLYRYLRKFHSMGNRRYVVLRLRDLVPVAAAMLTFEFATRRRSPQPVESLASRRRPSSPLRLGLHGRSGLPRRLRWPTAFAAIACAIAGSLLGGPTSGAAAVPLSISIVGNHFVNGAGHTIRLLGVNHTSAEYGCVDGFGYDDGHFNNADAAAIASWGANAVRIPLNEDCWLGINGQPNSNEGANPPLTQDGYQQAIKRYVADLNAHGIYAILDLHWTAPGTQVALEQQPMPDKDHSPAFWASVAATFKDNPAVVFDLFNEPYDPTDPRSGDDKDSGDKVTWGCWETGTKPDPIGGGAPAEPCFTEAYDENANPTTRYQIAGMQTLLDAVRNTGAKQPVMTGGLDYANDLGESDHGKQWMDHAPDDPLDQEAASFHNYMGKGCDTKACWKNTIAPVAAHVPVVTGEFDEDNFDEHKCADQKPSMFDAKYMDWADSAGVSYLAWGWIVETKAEQDADGCNALFLIDNYKKHTPAKPNGVALRAHLRGLEPAITLTTFTASVRSGGTSVAFTLRSAQTCAGRLTGSTVHPYATANGTRRKASLGSAHVSLKAHHTTTIVLTLSQPARALLARMTSLRVRITITLSGDKHRRTVTHHTVTLKDTSR